MMVVDEKSGHHLNSYNSFRGEKNVYSVYHGNPSASYSRNIESRATGLVDPLI